MKFPEEGSKYFQSRINSLRMIGCWPMIGTIKSRFEKFYTVCCCIAFGNVILGTSLSFSGLIETFEKNGEFNVHVCDQIILFIISFQVLMKMLVTILKAQKIEKLVEDLNVHMNREYILRPEDTETMDECNKYDKKLSRFFFVISFVITAVMCFRPLITTIKHVLAIRHLHNVTIIGDLPSQTGFELLATSPSYYFWYTQQLSMGLMSAWCSWVSDSMFCGLIRYLCGHFEILVRNVKREELDLQEKDIVTRNKKTYKKIILHHNDLIRYNNELIDAFAPLMITQLLLGAVTIGLVMIQFNLTKGDPLLLAKPIAYLILKIVQLLLLSWNGQLLWDKSVEISDAFYFTSWYEKPRTICLDMKMIIMRSQKPLKFAHSRVFSLSAPSFFQILSKAYNYYAMLRTMKHG